MSVIWEIEIRPLAFLLAYLGINSMWKSISEKRQCSAKNRHNAQHNKDKSIRCATKRIKARPAAFINGRRRGTREESRK